MLGEYLCQKLNIFLQPKFGFKKSGFLEILKIKPFPEPKVALRYDRISSSEFEKLKDL